MTTGTAQPRHAVAAREKNQPCPPGHPGPAPAASTILAILKQADSAYAILTRPARTGQPAGHDLLAALAALSPLRASVDALEHALVRHARAAGIQWAGIADVLGLATRQAAQQRTRRRNATAPAPAPASPAAPELDGQTTLDDFLSGDPAADDASGSTPR